MGCRSINEQIKMSKDVCLVGATGFRLLHGEHVDAEAVILGLIENHMDGSGVTLEMLHASDDGDRYVLEMETEEVGHSFPERLENLIKAMSPHVLDAFSVTIREDVMSDDRDQVIYGGPSPEAIEAFRIEHSVKEVQQYLGDVKVREALLKVLLQDPQIKDLLPVEPVSEKGPGNPKDVFLGFSADGYWSNDLGWVDSPADATQFDATEALNVDHLMGSGVCVLEVDPLMLGVLPTQSDLSRHVEQLIHDRQGGDITQEDKIWLVEAFKGEFPLLNSDAVAFMPAVLALLNREREAIRISAPRHRG
jgi:hypothetical protein